MSDYSDFELKVATQVAYMNIELDEEHSDWTIKMYLENDSDLAESVKTRDPAAYDAIMNGSCQDWKVVHNVTNEESGNGFAACLIETGDNKAIVGFRGSEDFHNPENLKHDWIEADVGLLNSTQTSQQKSAEEYIKYINKNYNYDSYELTGHSLGGNLAEHALITAPESFAGKVNNVLNLDGPGFSDEYIIKNKAAIEQRSGKIDHYQCSLVGAMLNPLPGTNYQHMESSERDGLVWRHSTKNMLYDEHGNMIHAKEMDQLSRLSAAVSNMADDYTIGEGLFGGLMFIGLLFIPASYPFIGDFIARYISSVIETSRKYKESRGNAEFGVIPPVLGESSSQFADAASRLMQYANEVDDIRNELSFFIKLSSLFTLGFKLRKVTGNIEKMSRKCTKMQQTGDEIQELYNKYENKITANAG